MAVTVGATVRDATFDLFRRRGLTTLFANPGLDGGAVPRRPSGRPPLRARPARGLGVGLATGYAIGRGEPALALLHTTAGLGNAVAALATARVNRAPLVVIVGQQDRRHLAYEPFLAGKLAGLAGEYPVSRRAAGARAGRPGRDRARVPRSRDEPRARARDRADGRLGGAGRRRARARRRRRAPSFGRRRPPRGRRRARGRSSPRPRSPALVVGAGADHPRDVGGARRARRAAVAPVFQEPFGGRAGLPAGPSALRGRAPRRPAAPARAARARTTPCSSSARPCFRQSRVRPRAA